jgi:hypothetical protein
VWGSISEDIVLKRLGITAHDFDPWMENNWMHTKFYDRVLDIGPVMSDAWVPTENS